MKQGWDLITQHIKIEPPADLNLYLGCIHRQDKLKVDGKSFTTIEYDMEEYLTSIVEKYKSLAEKTTGQAVKLRKAATPFLPEDMKESPAGMPAASGPRITCPWCRHTFPINPQVPDNSAHGGACAEPITETEIEQAYEQLSAAIQGRPTCGSSECLCR